MIIIDFMFGYKMNTHRPTQIVSIIVTHQNRLKCLLNTFMDVKYKFGNCSALQMKFIRDRDHIRYEIDLIFNGFTKSNKKYYTTTPNPKNKNTYPFEKIIGVTKHFLDIPVSSLLPNVEYIFILIRHGQATHNQYNYLTKIKSLYKTDTLLTEEGENQAIKTGEFMKKYLSSQGLKINYIFTSDLKRTRQTTTLIIDQIKPIGIREMIVLPCAHELSYFHKKNCDLKMINHIKGKLSGENKMRCDFKKCDINPELYCCSVVYGDTKLSVNWIYYQDFYEGTRNDIYTTSTKKSCFDTNMIKNATQIILLEMNL
jgi:broad specificity phosphatase PhoE